MTPRPQRPIRIWGIAVLLLSTALGAFYLLSPSPPQGLNDRTQWLANGPSLPAFSLPSTQGVLDIDHMKGHWTLWLFGYTHCPDVCPTDLGVLARVMQQRRTAHQLLPQTIFVSVDPTRDSLPLLARYLTAFDPSFIGAQADKSQLQPFTQTMGVYAALHTDERDASGNYPVDHSTSFYLFNPAGTLQASFQNPQSVQELIQQFQRIIPNS
ncbi:MAG: SCO family protein [Betaproteobacteria bacterium]|nr:SCO family protein [Betaproteobacteria bacterium]